MTVEHRNGVKASNNIYIYIYIKMNFWSRTSSKTFNCYSEFHASNEAIIRLLTTITVTCKDI